MKYEEGLEKLRFNEKTGKWYHKKHRTPYFLKDACAYQKCGKRFFAQNDRSKYCDMSCRGKAYNPLRDDPEARRKKDETIKMKYGVDNISQLPAAKEKKKQTCLKNHGVDNPSKSPEIQQRKIETWLENFGYENPMQCPEIKQKYINNMVLKHGVEWPMHITEVVEKHFMGENNPFFNKRHTPDTLIKISGENHYAWKGLSEDEQRIRKTSQYQQWREIVLIRDKRTCQMCKTTDADFEVHHIVPFAENGARRLDPKNGITLCTTCHYSIKNREHLFEEKFFEYTEKFTEKRYTTPIHYIDPRKWVDIKANDGLIPMEL